MLADPLQDSVSRPVTAFCEPEGIYKGIGQPQWGVIEVLPIPGEILVLGARTLESRCGILNEGRLKKETLSTTWNKLCFLVASSQPINESLAVAYQAADLLPR